MAYIVCKDLILGYDGKAIVSGLNFEVNKGDYLCIVGENGTGKSTLVKSMISLIKPMAGNISFEDGVKPYEIGYLPQQTIVQKDFPASVWEIVLSGTLSNSGKRPFYTKNDKLLAKENMKKLSIYDLKDRSYRFLSGGQQQRVLLARALCATSKIILLDEPVTGLDPKVTSEFYGLIKQLNNEGVTVIMVSHDLQAAITYATNILYIGRDNSFVGTKEEYIKSKFYRDLEIDGGANND